jgi:predicted nucleic acid-binding protein
MHVPARKDGIPVVLDTNVVIGYYLSRNPNSANSQVYRLWRDQRTLQLIVSDLVTKEYLQVLLSLGVEDHRVQRLADRLNPRPRRQTAALLGESRSRTAPAATLKMRWSGPNFQGSLRA